MTTLANLSRLGAAALAAASVFTCAAEVSAQPAAVTLPPRAAGFDYQIGGPYPPPAGVRVVSRDYSVAPAEGLYNICYVNGFQVQTGAEREWDPDLLLRDANGELVIDEDWNEVLLDIRTEDKRARIAAKVNGWIDTCAAKRYQAVEPDNYDSYTRSKDLLTADQAQSFIRRLSAHAHARGLAIAQKNAAELADNRTRNGLDFAVAEECGDTDECEIYANAFADNVVDVEYTAAGLSAACAGFKSRISIVRRDRDVVPQGSPGYLRRTC
ncbi:endo alpha-1,4 polygalactosaminidase [Nocardia sp. CDC159]|uniref:Endo alpha-1,4 polygalactosaminidase n=1 Tax=Nocardia pulmonis TaxID=2951408 RepID=A0A9X2IYB4_9NOCA|nr:MULTISPECIES: endo alpha-1,4 polygalactosaminidase [Nocardia]MCM6773741.1 endo alpha-1,4 polygalactosaminidase [Nocardia pulmonis]MCM6786628.1 endo alpha-1,4 polygalactosaminidase [Nocardia sp. CDC159]